MIHIRLAIVQDAPQLNELNAMFNGSSSSSIEVIEDSLKNNKQEIVYVATDENRLVGFCGGQIMASMCYAFMFAEITELYVLKEYRGQGIARQLFMTTEKVLREKGVKHIHVLTDRENYPAQKLYHSCGYSDTTEILLDKDIVD